jgi:hypothetical protein
MLTNAALRAVWVAIRNWPALRFAILIPIFKEPIAIRSLAPSSPKHIGKRLRADLADVTTRFLPHRDRNLTKVFSPPGIAKVEECTFLLLIGE